MKKLMVAMALAALTLSGALAQAKLSDVQSMKCIDGDKQTKSVFQDLQAAYEMRLVTAKDFFKVMEKPSTCPQLRTDLKKLHASAVSAFPRTKSATRLDSFEGGSSGGFGSSSGGGYDSAPATPDFGGFPPPPAPMPDSDFGDDFSDFR
jgi:hypothetical protein